MKGDTVTEHAARSQVGGSWRHRSCGGYELYLVRNFPPPVRKCGVPAGAAEAAAVAVAPGRAGSKQWRETQADAEEQVDEGVTQLLCRCRAETHRTRGDVRRRQLRIVGRAEGELNP